MQDSAREPPVLAVDVDTQQVEAGRHAVLMEEGHDAALVDELAMQVDGQILNLAVHQQARPAMLAQPACVALHAVLHPKFNVVAIAGVRELEDVLQDAILAVLRVPSELGASKAVEPLYDVGRNERRGG